LNQINTAIDRNACAQLDDQLSQRFIALDPLGYFLIRVDVAAAELVVVYIALRVAGRVMQSYSTGGWFTRVGRASRQAYATLSTIECTWSAARCKLATCSEA
jgi:hypothetical protein